MPLTTESRPHRPNPPEQLCNPRISCGRRMLHHRRRNSRLCSALLLTSNWNNCTILQLPRKYYAKIKRLFTVLSPSVDPGQRTNTHFTINRAYTIKYRIRGVGGGSKHYPASFYTDMHLKCMFLITETALRTIMLQCSSRYNAPARRAIDQKICLPSRVPTSSPRHPRPPLLRLFWNPLGRACARFAINAA